MSPLRKIVDERDARACLSSVARSGETLRAWAKRHHVDGRSLNAWKRNLARWTTTPLPRRKARLVELVPVSRTAPEARRYLVRVGEAALEVGDDFDAGTLRRLIEVLRAC
ncbi:MAG: hypothetical protein KF795_00775 [Labilithrix sp.]|nr:hypothetical protein [Labilithrix sp.]